MRFILFITVLFVHVVTHAQSVPSMSEIGIEFDEGQSLPLTNKISFEVLSSNSGEIMKVLSKWSNIIVDDNGNDRLNVSIVGQTRFQGEVLDRHSTKSFVIDFDESSVKRFVSGFMPCLLYTSPSPRDLSTSRMPSSA